MARPKGSKNKQSWNRRLTDGIKSLLGAKADSRTIQEWIDNDEEIRDAMSQGNATPLLCDLLARKIVQLAVDPSNKNQWAVELVFDRVEGKPMQGQPPDDGGRQIEDRLNDLGRNILNNIAKPHVSAAAPHEPSAEERAAGPASKLLDLPSNRAGSSQDAR